MNKKRLLFIICLFLLTILVVAVLFKGTAKTIASSNCHKTKISHQVYIKTNVVIPEHTSGHLCDTMTIINKDNNIRLIAFGPHAHHISYDGISEVALGQNQSLNITLNSLGSHQFHDHLNEQIKGTFSVSK